MRFKKFEEYSVINKNELGNNWSADYHINKQQGKLPHTKKGGYLIQIEEGKTIPQNAIYLTPEDAQKYNELAKEIIKLQAQQKTILQ
jgi:hypothetical protein